MVSIISINKLLGKMHNSSMHTCIYQTCALTVLLCTPITSMTQHCPNKRQSTTVCITQHSLQMGRHMQSHIKASQEKNFLTIVNLQFHDNRVHKYSLYMYTFVTQTNLHVFQNSLWYEFGQANFFPKCHRKKKMKLMKTDPLKSHG